MRDTLLLFVIVCAGLYISWLSIGLSRIVVAPNHIPSLTKILQYEATTTADNIASSTTPTKTSVAATTKPEQKKPAAPKPTENTPAPTPPPQNTVQTMPAPDFASINESARASVVNLICSTASGSLNPITASGVVIDPRGVIITNAHVGLYWLIRDFRTKDFLDCVVRTGSPAYPRYHAELLYISPVWVENNKDILTETNPKGTGEDDFAFLRITGTVNDTSLSALPFTKPTVREVIETGEPVLLTSYPAGFLGGISVLQNLNLTSAITTIKEIFTFKETTIDLISVPGTVVSQKGASGGGVFDRDGALLGIISTSSDGTTTSDRDLRAITMAHVNRELQKETGKDLGQFLSGDIATAAARFSHDTAPALAQMVENELLKK